MWGLWDSPPQDMAREGRRQETEEETQEESGWIRSKAGFPFPRVASHSHLAVTAALQAGQAR